MPPTLLEDIETFLKARDMTPTRFGHLAMSDKAFVFDLRNGREVFSRTEKRARNFMLSYTDQ